MTTKKDLAFTTNAISGGEYWTFEITVRYGWLAYGSESEMVTFSWQTDRSADDWYAFRAKTEVRSLEQHQEASKLMGALFRYLKKRGNYSPQPAMVAEWLRRRATESVYDSRERDYIALSEVKSIEYLSWSDDWRAIGRKNPTTSVLAKTEADAKVGIGKALVEHSPLYDAVLIDWIQADRPVRIMDKSVPDTKTMEEKARLPWSPDSW